MALISFSPTTDWVKARWVVFRFLEDIIASFHDDSDLVSALRRAIALDGLLLHRQEKPLAHRLLVAMKAIAETTLEGSDRFELKWKEGLDEESQDGYRRAMTELLSYAAEELRSE